MLRALALPLVLLPITVRAAPLPVQEADFLSLSADARDESGAGHAFLELEAPGGTALAPAPLRLRLCFGLEAEFARTSLVQLFHRELDVPVQVSAPWIADLAPAVDDAPGADAPQASFALGERPARARRLADRTLDGRAYEVWELEGVLAPRAPGELVLAAPTLRYAYATHFEDDALRGRVPTDRVEAFVRGVALALDVAALPELGRPLEFSGAVGRFSLAADAEPRELELGASLRLELRIEGPGNLETFTPPRLEGLSGFHLRGTLDATEGGVRSISYDLAPLSETVREIPPIAFSFYDPGADGGSAAYRTLWTEALPIVVRTARHPSAAPPAAPPAAAAQKPTPAVRIALVVVPGLIVLGLFLWLRVQRRRGDALGHGRIRAHAAALSFRARAGAPGADPAQALAEFLAARLSLSATAVDAPDLGRRLEAAGVPQELARRAAALLEELLGARYGGRARPDGLDAAAALVEELELVLRPDGPRR